MHYKFIKWFEELSKADIPLVGGKCANLGEMVSKVQVPVPPGFAITAEAYRFHILQNGLQTKIGKALEDLDTHDLKNLEEKGERVRRLILDAELPKELVNEIADAYQELSARLKMKNPHVAVRSSATAEDLPDASFAGAQETYLNVAGEELLMRRVKDCFSSLFTNRAISYREDKGFDHFRVLLSVAVQKMVNSKCAGVSFTIEPDSGHENFVMINGSWGLGEYIVKGRINPDTYLVFKPTSAVIEKKMGTKEVKLVRDEVENKEVKVDEEARNTFVLEDQEARKIAKYSMDIEQHYKTPMDIEWAKDEDGKLYILQARPETVHAVKRKNIIEVYELKQKGTVLVSGEAVGRKIGQGVVNVIEDPKEIGRFKPKQVLVADMTDPDWEPIMKMASAIVTNRGGRTSHCAIVSRELGIPAVIGTQNATKVLKSGQDVTVVCAEGEGNVYRGLLKYERKEINVDKLPTTKTKIYVNVGIPEQALSAGQLPVDGVGLARLEFIINSYIGKHPLHLIKIGKPEIFVDGLAAGIAKIAASFYPRPVIVRLSDFKSNEYANLEGGKAYEPAESNPMLGWRGASRYYDPKFLPAFKLECKALKKVREEFGLTNVKAMIPFCRTPEEGRRVISIMEYEGLKRGRNGFEVWCMAEVPSNVILADEFSRIFDGFSIGSNDLTQLVLGLDRDSEQVSHLFDERDEAVKRMISQLIKTAHTHGRPVSICGQAPSDFPDFAEFLVKEGIDSISLNSDVAVQTKVDVIAPAEKKFRR
jgi:pyruvate,water dikinase